MIEKFCISIQIFEDHIVMIEKFCISIQIFEDHIVMIEKFCISLWISEKFVPKGPIDNKSTLVQVMAWHWTGIEPLLEPMLTKFTNTHMRH